MTETNQSGVVVLYHGNCWDGFCAAWLFHQVFPDAEYVPVQYGQDPPDCTGKWVYIVDFSYKRDVMRRIMSQAAFVCVLDHHKTAQAELHGIVDEFVQRPDLIANPLGSELPFVWFDMGKSGGRLAWEYLWDTHYGQRYSSIFRTGPGQPSTLDRTHAPWLVDYTEDRDLWRWKLPHSRAITTCLRSHPLDFGLWSQFDAADPMEFVAEGEAILRSEQVMIDNHVRNAREIDMDGHKILAVNATVLFSDIAGKLSEGRPFGAAYFDRGDGRRQWSLRSRDDGVDVSEIARARGGGGHRNAAGFEETT